jgi:hypothetical protein
MNNETAVNKRFNLALNLSEAILVRDSLIEMKHLLKNSPSERGQKLCGMANDLAKQLTARTR